MKTRSRNRSGKVRVFGHCSPEISGYDFETQSSKQDWKSSVEVHCFSYVSERREEESALKSLTEKRFISPEKSMMSFCDKSKIAELCGSDTRAMPLTVSLTKKKERDAQIENIPESWWPCIFKAADGEQGKGIQIHANKESALASRDLPRVASELVQDFVLLNGHKCDMRMYCLYEPWRRRVVMYDDAIVRMARSPFVPFGTSEPSTSKTDDSKVHLTNCSLRDNKDVINGEKALSVYILDPTDREKMLSNTLEALAEVGSRVFPTEYKGASREFLLFGFDVLCKQNHEVKILEFNSGWDRSFQGLPVSESVNLPMIRSLTTAMVDNCTPTNTRAACF